MALAGCIGSSSVPCASGVCASGTVCVQVADPDHPGKPVDDLCVTADQLHACDGLAGGAACEFGGDPTAGRCYDGICLQGGCGNGRVDRADGETCDDGNALVGDGCSASCRSDETCGNGVIDPIVASGQGELCDDHDRDPHDACDGNCQPELPRWTRILYGILPSLRSDTAMAYMTSRSQIVLFGGQRAVTTTALFDDTWVYNGRGWELLQPVSSPPARLGHAMAYDAARDRVVLFGGQTQSTQKAFDDTWEWDGATWSVMAPAGALPPSRAHAAMAYDPRRDRVVLFGGELPGRAARLADTWTWNGTSWTQLPSPQAPGGQSCHAMAYDPSRGVIVMVGVNPSATTVTVWELVGDTWMERTTMTAPPERTEAVLAYDPVARAVILAGGISALGTPLADAWRWNGQDWSPAPSIDTRIGGAAATDPQRRTVVLFGGMLAANGMRGGVAELDGGTWRAPTFANITPRRNLAAAYDARRGEVIMFGGVVGDAGWLPDTLVLGKGLTWKIASAPGAPAAQAEVALGYDARRGQVVAFGGFGAGGASNTTSIWDGAAWSPRGAGPPARRGASMAYDRARDRMVLFGGISASGTLLGDTWEWDGSSWAERTPALPSPSPAPRTRFALAYDPIRKEVVLFGGTDSRTNPNFFDDTWIWNGTTWTPRVLSPRPVPRSSTAMAWNPARARLTLFGGATTEAVFADTWEWDGAQWSTVSVPGAPVRRFGHAMASSPDGSGVLMFGGSLDVGPDNDQLWLLRWESSSPAETCSGYDDRDLDQLRGCADPDCWTVCAPECSPGVSCLADASRCGDGTCDPRETCRICAADCGACTPTCGDELCDPGEVCPGDCP